MDAVNVIMAQRYAYLLTEIERLKKENREYKSTVYDLNNTVRQQARTIKDLTKKTVKMLEEGKTLLNKDELTFRQAFIQRCGDKYILAHLDTFLGTFPTWDNLTSSNLEKFAVWLKTAQNRRTGETISPSTAALYITKLKSVLKWGATNKKDVSSVLKTERSAKCKKVFLRPNDLSKLLAERPNDPNELYAWKMFLISAITGARMSDCVNLSLNNLDGNTLRYIPQKTHSTECFVSLTQEAKKVLERLLSIEVEPCADMNKEIKKVCRASGLVRKFDIGANGSKVVEMCDAVKMHTARHSFATNKFRYSSWTERQIADACGHTSFTQTFNSYIIDKSPVSDDERLEQQSDIF